MEISVVCPTLNEEKYIEHILRFFQSSEPVQKELFIIDGGSTDRTCEIVRQWQQKHSNLHLLHNAHRYVPYALNLAIPRCKGDIIVRLDAHTEYAPDYFTHIVQTFRRVDADIVGGPMRAVGKTGFQKAVAYATSTRMGIGDSMFHDEDFEGYVDSVYLGAWKREIFSEVGLFDERMVRNQDDEFHYRAKSKGKKIYLNPRIRSFYFPRSNFSKLFKQYYQYGLYKPLVLQKVPSEAKFRHLIPSLFTLYLITLPFWIWLSPLFIMPLVLYAGLALYFSLTSPLPRRSRLLCLGIYPVLHVAYGSGFLAGLVKLLAGPR